MSPAASFDFRGSFATGSAGSAGLGGAPHCG